MYQTTGYPIDLDVRRAYRARRTRRRLRAIVAEAVDAGIDAPVRGRKLRSDRAALRQAGLGACVGQRDAGEVAASLGLEGQAVPQRSDGCGVVFGRADREAVGRVEGPSRLPLTGLRTGS
jgi:hypothetical protein